MPTYEYRCEKCGHAFEEFQSISAKPIKKCPKCGKLAVKRLISAGAGIIFRGSGFYETDYRSEHYQAAAKKEADAGKPESAAAATAAGAKADAAGSAKSDAKSDSRPEEKAQPAAPAPAASAPAAATKSAATPKAAKSAKK